MGLEKGHWRLWRSLRNGEGRKELLNEVKPAPLSKTVSKQIKSDKDARGARRGSENN